MATKRELKAEIETLSQQLGVSVDTDRLNLEGLNKLTEDLRQQLAAREADGGSPPPEATAEVPPAREPPEPEPGLSLFGAGGATKRNQPAPPPAPEPEPEPEATSSSPSEPISMPLDPGMIAGATDGPTLAGPRRYRVAQGCVVYSNRGKIGAFQQISARDLPGGQEALDELVRAGQVERKR